MDSWAVVPIHSVSREGHELEGTRLTVVRVADMPDGYEFSIRTPVTPDRWLDFDEVRFPLSRHASSPAVMLLFLTCPVYDQVQLDN